MPPTYTTQLLQELGWDDGTRVPLANAENKALENNLVSRQSEIQRLKEAVALQDQKQADLDRYRGNITTEYNENNKLLVAHKQQLDEELKLKQVANIERDKLNMEISQMRKRCADIKERIERVQCNMSHVLKKADMLKSSVCGDRMALKEWMEALERSACDIETIEKYTKQDNSKAKDLETKRQKLKQEHDRIHNRLTELCSSLSAEERACERISNQVTVALVERRRLIDTWSGAVENLRQRDKDIKHLQEDYELLREESRRKVELTREKEQFLQQQLGNNAEAENEMAALAQELAHIRQRTLMLNENNKTLESDMKSLQRMLANVSQELQRIRKENKHTIEDQHKKENALDELKEKISSLKQKHAESMDKSKSSEDRAKELEDMLNEEEKYFNNLKVNHQRSMHCSYLEQQKLKALKNDEKLIAMQMKGCKTAVSKLDTKALQIEKELLLQKESLYAINFSVETTGVRIARMEGDMVARVCDAVLDEKVEQRERAATEHGARLSLLQDQVRRLDEDMRRLTRAIADKQADHEDLRSRLKGQGLGLVGQQQLLREARTECRGLRVEESLMRLRVAHADRAVARLDDRAYTLEKQRLEVDAAMNERQVEIGIRRDILNVQKRALMEDCSKLRFNIRERAGRIEQLKKRFDIFIASLGKDDSGEQLSVTYFKIKFAQEKASLQQQGDELDIDIKRSEHEIASMEASLHVMAMAHKQFVKHVSVVKDDDPQMQLIEELRVEYYRLKAALDALRAQIRTHDGRVAQLNATLTQLGEKSAVLHQEEAEVENDLDSLVEQLQKQESKLEHARSTAKTYSRRAHRLVTEADMWQVFELEMSNRSYLEAQYSALRQLLDTAKVSPEIADTLAAYVREQNIRGLVQKQHRRSLNFIDSILMGNALHQAANIDASPSGSVISSHEGSPSVAKQSTTGGNGYTRRLKVFRSELSKKLQEPCLLDDQSDRGSSRSSLPMKVVSLGLDLEPVKESKSSSHTTLSPE